LLFLSLSYSCLARLIKIKIKDYYRIIYFVQILLAFIAILVILEYIFPNFSSFNIGFIQDYRLQEKGFSRWQHSSYPLAMVSFFLASVVLPSNYFNMKEKLIAVLSLIPQIFSLLIANYRATILVSLLFIALSILSHFLFTKKNRIVGLITLSTILLFFIALFTSEYINTIFGSSDWFSRLEATQSINSDANFYWRIIEAGLAISKMNSGDYVFGVGFSQPFYYAGYKIFCLHDGFISIFFNFGIAGSLLFVSLVAIYIFIVTKKFFKSNKYIFSVSMSFLLALLIQNLSIGIFYREYAFVLAIIIFFFFSLKYPVTETNYNGGSTVKLINEK